LIVIPIHLVSCWLLVVYLDFGLRGASMANNITALLTFSS
jgi:hypothetical protein